MILKFDVVKTLLCILAVFIPPLAVLINGGCNCNLLINVLLTILGLVPGVIHAWYLICYAEPLSTEGIVFAQGHDNGPFSYQ